MNRAERRRRTHGSVLAQLRDVQHALRDERMREQPGRLKKRRALDCGRPRCALCGNPRRLGLKQALTPQELRQQERYREGLLSLAVE
jgi:hypothetical protein